ncbi:phage portal protein [Pseudomonas aeruginosa]|uniref:phage portal protein n=1 Tax=Pseudomonas aeruginosa TaxID=287 RepID=UPI001AAF15FA|nr:phage portal protein [Pseudomonas aeruginosa]MBO2834603.1 phage portal protein [Pseudomonas aeruginosa]
MNPLKRAWQWARGGGARAPAAADRVEPTVGRRSFKMAGGGRLGAGWGQRTSGTDANQEIYADHETLRQRAREQSINSPYLKRFYRLLRQNVIGPYGINLQSKAVMPDGTPDRVARRLIEKEFRRFCKRGKFDVTGQYSFVSFLWLWIETLARDGEVLVRLVRNWKRNRWGFAVQILEADRLDINLNTLLDNGNRVRMGVELDEWEAPVAYWMLNDHPGDVHRSAADRYTRIPADELIHTFDPWRPHQARGFTWTHAAALDIHHLGEFRTSALIKAELGAKITGFYEQDAEFLDPPDEGDDAPVHEEVEAGTAKVLPYGLKWKDRQNASPGSDYAPFVKDSLRGSAAGLGPSYNRISHDLEGVSFSSLRDGTLDERDFYKCCQELVISSLLERLGEEWFDSAVLHGAIKIPARDLERCSEQVWQPRGWDWVDPLKDSKAATESIGNRTKTRSQLIRQNGDDPDEIFAELEAEEQMLRDKGLLPAPQPKQQEKPVDDDQLEDAGDE